jgi:hypothetical protein
MAVWPVTVTYTGRSASACTRLGTETPTKTAQSPRIGIRMQDAPATGIPISTVSWRYAPRVSEAPYREQPPKPPDPWLAAWARLRRRRAVALWAALLSALAFTVLVVAVVAKANRSASIAGVSMVAGWITWIAVRSVLRAFPCPRCDSTFHGSGRGETLPWADACAGCGIAIGTPKYPGAPRCGA